MPANTAQGIPVSQTGKNRFSQLVAVPGITTAAYAANKAVGTVITFPNMAGSLGTGKIVGLKIVDSATTASAGAGLVLMLYKSLLGTPIADKATFQVAAADAPLVIAGFAPDGGNWMGLGTVGQIWTTMFAPATPFNPKQFELGAGNTSLYGQLYTTVGVDYTGHLTALSVGLDVEMD